LLKILIGLLVLAQFHVDQAAHVIGRRIILIGLQGLIYLAQRNPHLRALVIHARQFGMHLCAGAGTRFILLRADCPPPDGVPQPARMVNENTM